MNADIIKSVAATHDKGDVIPWERVVKATGISRADADRFKLACLGFKEAVEKTRREMGSPVVIRITRDGIRVLTDPEASRWTVKRFGAHKRGLRRSHSKATEVNVANLSQEELEQHERNLAVQSRQLQAIRRRALPELRPVGAE